MKKEFCSFFSFIVLFISSCGSHEESIKAVRQNISESVYASGVVKALEQYDVFSTSNGILTTVFVKVGDSVKAGMPLLKIDNAVSELSSANAKLNMERLKDKSGQSSATLLDLESRMRLAAEKYKSDSLLFERQKVLWQQNVGSKLEYEKRELAFNASQTEYNSARLQYEQVKSDLEKEYRQSKNNYLISQKQQTDFLVKSNIDGIVYAIYKDPGEYVSALTPVAVIGKAGVFELELQVDEYDIVNIKPGQQVFVTMDSYRGEVYQAKISRIEPFMNDRTRTFRVWADFTDAPEVLYPNLSVEANILIAKKEDALTIPSEYLIGSDRVLISPQDTISVTTGISNMQWVEIVKGLNPGQEVYKPSR